MCASVCIHVRVEAGAQPWKSFTMVLRQSLTGLELTSKLQESSCLSLSGAGITPMHHPAWHFFSCVSWGLNSGTRVCKPYTLGAITPGFKSFLRQTFGLSLYYRGSVAPCCCLPRFLATHTLSYCFVLRVPPQSALLVLQLGRRLNQDSLRFHTTNANSSQWQKIPSPEHLPCSAGYAWPFMRPSQALLSLCESFYCP